MALPRFLPTWLGGECDRVDGGVPIPVPEAPVDALLKRPVRDDEALPEDLERLLRDPEISIPQDRLAHDLIRSHLRGDPEATVTREAYLSLFRLLDEAEGEA